MIQLFDYYNQETQDLHDSLLAAGYDCPTIVIEANGFLPDDMISPYTYFLGDEEGADHPLFFNQVPVPPFWEITGDHQAARVSDMGEERARIHYASQAKGRLVKQVDWLDKKGQLRLSERYNKQGRCFAKTAYKSGQEAFNTTYYSTDGQERIVENHATGDIILTLDQEPLRIFKSRVDFIRFFLELLDLITFSLIRWLILSWFPTA